jgi:hypothetical protein
MHRVRSICFVKRVVVCLELASAWRNDKYQDIQIGDEIVGGPFCKIITFASFRMASVTYRCCGTKVQF